MINSTPETLRRFHLYRVEDESGISGTGVVAEGVRFSTGEVALAWLTEIHSVSYYKTLEDVITIHGHGGKTLIKWMDGAL